LAHDGKIFCIGFHKTGTTSLAVALTTLGYRVHGAFGLGDPEIGEHVHARADEIVARFDAFQDNPWPIIYQGLDARYPDSKFILTLRNPESWLRSVVAHFGGSVTPMREWIYGPGGGDPIGNEERYTARYEQHNAEALKYFAGRPTDLLVMDFSAGDGWSELCAFLDQPIPAEPFPHANSANDRSRRPGVLNRVRGRLRRLVG